ncbi:type IV secretory system conjugative DNA transfer family protein [Nocardia blacklockiae]|uniref:type IV secretory system conjugative DNA transfer family protein n=1 Tax=Nocardia blacklockiae TaxID=480036 RepID=UPI0018942718|nr:TraM recognition domain-containing protein [Nocardia blacklockiae]MBF6176034.1 TraM recognition domain-containing protein [Nocardia blacklockiae]
MARRETRRRSTGGLGEETWLLLLALAAMAITLSVWLALSLGSWWAGLPVTRHPVLALLEVIGGDHAWPWQSTVILAGFACVTAGVAKAVWRRFLRADAIDSAARTMMPVRQISVGRRADNAAAARRLLKDAPADVRDLPGPLLGKTVVGGIELFLPAELGMFIAAGQRTGKTMAWAIPATLGAWGPVLATSNKPDLYRHTVAGREKRGLVWLCDLQGVDGTPQCNFWVDLLRLVPNLPAARKLASFFVSGASGSAAQAATAKKDDYFDGGAQELLALYLFAAARARGDLLHAAQWLSSDQDQTPALILRSKGHAQAASRILDAQSLYARQRDGLYDMARRYLNTLSDEGYARLITPPVRKRFTVYEADTGIVVQADLEPTINHHLPEFKPDEFVDSSNTLFALSQKGPDSATALTAALVGQVLEAGLAAARQRVDGRLAVPLLAVLDEAANCARVSELPEYYTYCGGCGIILITIVQVLEPAEELWGAGGVRTMRAQSIEIYGGNIATPSYLEEWVRAIDDHDVADHSRSHGPGGTNKTVSWRAEPILNVAKLSRLPMNRALVRLPGHEPVLVRKVFWWDNPALKPVVAESLSRFEHRATPLPPAPTPPGAAGAAGQTGGVEL